MGADYINASNISVSREEREREGKKEREGKREREKERKRYGEVDIGREAEEGRLKEVENEPCLTSIFFLQGITKGSQNAYIACQGCLKATVPAFWQMMWEQRACIIAMVTNEVEGGKVRGRGRDER